VLGQELADKEGKTSYHVQPGGILPERLKAMPYQQPPWSRKYPQLLKILADELGLPKGNVVRHNISYGGKWLDVEAKALPLLEFEGNLVDADPHFVNAQEQDFRLRPDSPALALGFQPIPVDRIGLYPDEYRK